VRRVPPGRSSKPAQLSGRDIAILCASGDCSAVERFVISELDPARLRPSQPRRHGLTSVKVGRHHANGYALVEQLISPGREAFVAAFKKRRRRGPRCRSARSTSSQFPSRPAFEVYGHFYPPMLFFLWGRPR
jgi:hypothetical protein